MATHSKLREELVEHLEQGIARASEAQDAIKFSESLVRREIHLTRLQLDIQLNKLETRTQFELKQTVERETKTIQHIIEQLNNIIKRVKSQDIAESELEMVSSDIEELLGLIKRKKIKFQESSDINTIFEGHENFGNFTITTISPGPKVKTPNIQVNNSSIEENVAHDKQSSKDESKRGRLLSSSEKQTNNDTGERFEIPDNHKQHDRDGTYKATLTKLSLSDNGPYSSSSPVNDQCTQHTMGSQSAHVPHCDIEHMNDQITDSNKTLRGTCEISNRNMGNIRTNNDEGVPLNRQNHETIRNIGFSHDGYIDNNMCETKFKPSPRRSLRSDSSKDANLKKTGDNIIDKPDLEKDFRKTVVVSDSYHDNNTNNDSHAGRNLRTTDDSNNKWAFGRRSRRKERSDWLINSYSSESNANDDNSSRLESGNFDDCCEYEDANNNFDNDNEYISRSERVERANREWFGDRTRGDKRSFTRQRSRSASPRSARIGSYGKVSHSNWEDRDQSDKVASEFKASRDVPTYNLKNHRQGDNLTLDINHLVIRDPGKYRVSLESNTLKGYVEDNTNSNCDSSENYETIDATLKASEGSPCTLEIPSFPHPVELDCFKTDMRENNETIDDDHYTACNMISEESLLNITSFNNEAYCEEKNNEENSVENILHGQFELADDAAETSEASSPNSVSSRCGSLNDNATDRPDGNTKANSEGVRSRPDESGNGKRKSNLRLKRLRNRSINDNIETIFKSQSLDNDQRTDNIGVIPGEKNDNEQRRDKLDINPGGIINNEDEITQNDSSRLVSAGEFANEHPGVESDGAVLHDHELNKQSDFVSHYCTIRRKRKGNVDKSNLSEMFQKPANTLSTSKTDKNVDKTVENHDPVAVELSGRRSSTNRSKSDHHSKSKLPSFNEMLYS